MPDQTATDGGQIIVSLVLGGLAIAFYLLMRNPKEPVPVQKEPEADVVAVETKKPAVYQSKKGKSKTANNGKPKSVTDLSHPWRAAQLKGHTDSVLGLCFTPNGKYLASFSLDRSIRLWPVKEFSSKVHSAWRINVELDHATALDFLPDSRVCVIALGQARKLRVIKLDHKTKKADTKGEFPEKAYPVELVGCGIHAVPPNDMRRGCNYLMACTADQKLEIRSLQGVLLESIDVKLGDVSFSTKSPCGRFVAVCGYVGDVKVLAVNSSQGNFTHLSKAFNVGQHKACVYHVFFSDDSQHCATVSKDGTWKVWNIDVEFQLGGDAKLVASGSYQDRGGALVCLAPDKQTVAVASGSSVNIYSATTGEVKAEIPNAHSKGRVTGVSFDSESNYLTSCGTDKIINVYNNVPGIQARVNRLKSELINATSAGAKERATTQLDQANQRLAATSTN